MKVKAATDKNFRRTKSVKPVKKRASAAWRLLKLPAGCAAVLIALLVVYQAFDFVLHASALQVRRIVVRGHVRLSSGEVQALVDGLRGSNILTVDLPGYRARLLESPWVADVAMRRVLPATIEVFVSEREPMALCRIKGQLYLIDRSATIIDEFGPKYKQFDMPIIDGAARGDPAGEPLLDERRISLAAAVIDGLADHRLLAERVSQIDVTDLFDAVVLLHEDPARLHLGTSRFAERLQGYIDIAERLRETVPDIEYANLQFDGRVYVKPAGTSGVHSVLHSGGKTGH